MSGIAPNVVLADVSRYSIPLGLVGTLGATGTSLGYLWDARSRQQKTTTALSLLSAGYTLYTTIDLISLALTVWPSAVTLNTFIKANGTGSGRLALLAGMALLGQITKPFFTLIGFLLPGTFSRWFSLFMFDLCSAAWLIYGAVYLYTVQLVDPAGNALPARKTGKIIFIVCSAVGGLAWIAGTIVTIRTIRKDRVKPHKYRDGIQVYSCGFLFWFLRIIWLVCSLMVYGVGLFGLGIATGSWLGTSARQGTSSGKWSFFAGTILPLLSPTVQFFRRRSSRPGQRRASLNLPADQVRCRMGRIALMVQYRMVFTPSPKSGHSSWASRDRRAWQ